MSLKYTALNRFCQSVNGTCGDTPKNALKGWIFNFLISIDGKNLL